MPSASAGAAPAAEQNARVMKNWYEQHGGLFGENTGRRPDMAEKKTGNSTVPVQGNIPPIWVGQLTPGALHRERRLTGDVIKHGVSEKAGGMYFVIKDAFGNLVKVGVLNVPGASPAVAARLFRRGKCITIIEPYLKSDADGLAFVYVENPGTDLLTDSHSLPGRDAAAWELEGNQLLKYYEAAGAFECWSRALSFATASGPVATILSNRAAALLKSERPAEAARDCLVALTIDQSQFKAAGRLVEALSRLNLTEAASLYAQGFIERWPGTKFTLQSYIQGPRSSEWEQAAAETLWWEKDAISKVLFSGAAVKGTDTTWDELKASGNDLFRSGSFNAAAEVYSRALSCVEGVDILVTLLCKRAAAAMLDKHHLCALTNATASLVLDSTDVQSWDRRASALRKLGMKESGLAACAQATQHLEGRGDSNAAFKPLAKTAAETETAPHATPKINTPGQMKNLEEFNDRLTQRGTVGRQNFSKTISVLGVTFPKTAAGPPESSLGQGASCGTDATTYTPEFSPSGRFFPRTAVGAAVPSTTMPSFHLELAKYRGWPKGVNLQWAKEHLHLGFEACRSLPYSMQLLLTEKDFTFSPKDMVKRSHGDPARLKWLLQIMQGKSNSNFGDIMPEQSMRAIDSSDIGRRNFTNQAYRADLLSLGTVHVAVGFVDLGVLLSSVVDEAPRGCSGPLRFVGVELSRFAVAKSLTIWQMTKDAAEGNTSAAAILQVWFSTTWQPSTEVAFRVAVRAVRRQSDKMYGSDAEVSRLLEHWSHSDGVSLKSARRQWVESVTLGHCETGTMQHIEDRLDMATYELTGDLFVGKSAGNLVGSLCWWDCPEETPANEANQTFLSAIDMWQVLKERSPKQSFFSAAEGYLLRRVEKMIAWARSGAVTVEAKVGNVEELARQIAALKPWTMTWSNVSDYYTPSKFHRIARACSANGDTMHFAYSMNWSIDVLGSHVMDYADAEKRKDIFKMAYEMLNGIYDLLTYKTVFRCPPPGHPMNVADMALTRHCYSMWIEHFFGIAKRGGACKFGRVEPAIYNPLSNSGSGTFFFTFCYNPNVMFPVNFD